MTSAVELRVDLADDLGSVSALMMRPPDPWLLYVLAHGAGAGMRHAFLEAISAALAARGVATLRFQFPYMESGRRSPDSPRTQKPRWPPQCGKPQHSRRSCRSSRAESRSAGA
jgi:predicted alpha/beta-hydrolase family hydrolase